MVVSHSFPLLYTLNILRNICDEAQCLYLLLHQKGPCKILSIIVPRSMNTNDISIGSRCWAKIVHWEGMHNSEASHWQNLKPDDLHFQSVEHQLLRTWVNNGRRVEGRSVFPTSCSSLPLWFRKEEAGKGSQLPRYHVICLWNSFNRGYWKPERVRNGLPSTLVRSWEYENQEDGIWKRQAQHSYLTRDLDAGKNCWTALKKPLSQPVFLTWCGPDSPARTQIKLQRRGICHHREVSTLGVSFDFPAIMRGNRKYLVPLYSPPLPCNLTLISRVQFFKTIPENLIWSILLSTGIKIKPLSPRVHGISLYYFLTIDVNRQLSRNKKCNLKNGATQNAPWREVRKKNLRTSKKKKKNHSEKSPFCYFVRRTSSVKLHPYRCYSVPSGRSCNRKWHLCLSSPFPLPNWQVPQRDCKEYLWWYKQELLRVFVPERKTGEGPRRERKISLSR